MAEMAQQRPEGRRGEDDYLRRGAKRVPRRYTPGWRRSETERLRTGVRVSRIILPSGIA
jgi:hypothetical protein